MEDKPKGKKAPYIAAAIGDRLLSAVSFVLAVILLLYGVYVLYDNAYLNRKAFVSQDLLQYKPDVEASDELLGFGDILELNPHTVGWLTIDGTNINYPVMQGKDNMEYLNKDPYGEFSLSGSIYLDVGNDSRFKDKYNIIYGHHMASGAMFGDIAKYEEEEFFRGHQQGLLQTPSCNYDLSVFAVLRGDAYDQTIYSLSKRNSVPHAEAMLRFAADNALWYDAASVPDVQRGKIVVLSTCADAYTNGRLLLFCSVMPRERPLPGKETEPPVHRVPVGHGENKWSLLDLCCTALTLLILLPLTYVRKKYRQIGYSRRTAAALAQLAPENPLALKTADEYGPHYIPGVIRKLRGFRRRMLAGTVLEAALTIGAAVLLLQTQDFSCPMTLIDKWTPLFLGITAAAWITDFICFRYRGDKPPAADKSETAAPGAAR